MVCSFFTIDSERIFVVRFGLADVSGHVLDPLTLTADDDLDEDMSEIGGLVWSCCTDDDQVSDTLYVSL